MIGVVTACLAVKTVTIKYHQLMDGMGKEEEKTRQGRINAAEIMTTKGRDEGRRVSSTVHEQACTTHALPPSPPAHTHTDSCACMHARTHKQVHIFTRMIAWIHIHAHTCARAYTNTRQCARARTHTHTYR